MVSFLLSSRFGASSAVCPQGENRHAAPVYISREKEATRIEAVSLVRFFLILPVLQSMKHTLSEQRKACPSIHHPFDQLELGILTFALAIVVRQGETCQYGCFVSLD